MRANLDALKDDILKQLAAQGFIVFPGYSRNPEPRPLAFWDTRTSTDFEPFLATARQVGTKLIVFNHLQFMPGMAEDAAEGLEDCEMPPEERRGYERRLRDMLAYHGFTCVLEISYDFEGRTFVFELQAAPLQRQHRREQPLRFGRLALPLEGVDPIGQSGQFGSLLER